MPTSPNARLKLVIIALALLYSGLSKADNKNGTTFFPLYPRLNIYGGTGDATYGRADMMAPLFGSTNAIVYTDVDGQIGDNNTWLGSLGLGARDAINNDMMWGGYIFADRFKSDDHDSHAYWLDFNPGVEFMTNHWDGRINAYIPSGTRKKVLGTFFADSAQINQPDAITRTGHKEFIRHSQYNVLFDKIEEIGPGGDLDVGYTFTSLKRLRVNAGTYYFNLPDTGNITGGEAGVEMPINNHLLLQFNDSYDNVQKNMAVVSVRFTLGGMDKSCATPTVQDRMLDPVYRHLGSLGTNSASPVNTRAINTHQIALERDNIWFFNPNSNGNSSTISQPSITDNECTFEHPCNNFSQTTINDINSIAPNANFYLTPGAYITNTNNLNLYSGQSIYGRTNDYTLPASPASGFPVFTGSITPQGNNTLDSFSLINNNSTQNFGIAITNANNVSMNNLQIGGTTDTQTYQESVVLNNAKNITLTNSTITSIQAGPQARVTGITEDNGSTATIESNTITITGKNSQGIYGLFVDNGSTGTINNNQFIFNMTNARDGMTGISVSNNSTLNANHNIFSMTLTKPPLNNNDPIRGIFAQSGALVNSNGNTFTMTSASTAVFPGFGGNTGLLAANSTIHSNNDHFTFNNFQNNTASGIGVIAGVQSNITLNNDVFKLNTTNSIGIFKTADGVVTGNNNIFNFNGTGTKTCGSFNSGNNNQFNGGCT